MAVGRHVGKYIFGYGRPNSTTVCPIMRFFLYEDTKSVHSDE